MTDAFPSRAAKVRLDRLPSGPQLCIDIWRFSLVLIVWNKKATR